MANNGQNRRAQDAAMAARLKADKVERVSARCPICHAIVALGNLPQHIAKPHSR